MNVDFENFDGGGEFLLNEPNRDPFAPDKDMNFMEMDILDELPVINSNKMPQINQFQPPILDPIMA